MGTQGTNNRQHGSLGDLKRGLSNDSPKASDKSMSLPGHTIDKGAIRTATAKSGKGK